MSGISVDPRHGPALQDVAAGTVLHVIGWHDNTLKNKSAPDADNWIGFGQRSTDDMSFCWVSSYSLSDDEFKQAVLERRKKQKPSNVSSSAAPLQ